MQRKIRWGILGAGEIVNRWMRGALQPEDMEVVAIASRTRKSADQKARKWSIPKIMSYDEMIASDEIDVVYIPVPHTAHKDLAIRAMKGGKHVLVEKPGAVNAADFEEMIACAKQNRVFFMEAVWTRFFPVMKKTLAYIEEGKIGDVRMVQSSFSFRVPDDDRSRLVDPAQGGGGLLDVGVYNLHLTQMIYKRAPVKLIGLASMDTDDLHLQVDEQASYIGQYDRGELSILTSGIRTHMMDTAYIYGTEGYLVLPTFWKPTRLEIVIGNHTEVIEENVPQKIPGIEDEGYQYEIAYVNECIRKGIGESPQLTWDASLSVLRQMDHLRKDWGLIYPFEKEKAAATARHARNTSPLYR